MGRARRASKQEKKSLQQQRHNKRRWRFQLLLPVYHCTFSSIDRREIQTLPNGTNNFEGGTRERRREEAQ